MKNNLTPQFFFDSLKNRYGNIECENDKITEIYEKLIEFLRKKNLLGKPESQSIYHLHIVANLLRFSGNISGYKKLVEEFHFDYPDFYPDLNTHIDCLAIKSYSFKELNKDCQKIAENLLNTMYEWVQVVKIALKDELLEIMDPKIVIKNNYYIAEYLSRLDNDVVNYFYVEAEELLPEYLTILNFPQQRKKRLRLAEELEKKIYQTEFKKLRELNVL